MSHFRQHLRHVRGIQSVTSIHLTHGKAVSIEWTFPEVIKVIVQVDVESNALIVDRAALVYLKKRMVDQNNTSRNAIGKTER